MVRKKVGEADDVRLCDGGCVRVWEGEGSGARGGGGERSNNVLVVLTACSVNRDGHA